jgi:AcrR family transcriptional regulator
MSQRGERREQTRRRVYEAALAIFREHGVAECRIDDIARRAGVSRAAFYFYFPTKEDVLIERMRETEGEIGQRFSTVAMDCPLETVLATLHDQLAIIWQGDAGLLPHVAGAALRTTAVAMSDQQATPLRSLVSERFMAAASRGEISDALPPQILSDLYLGHMLAGLLAWVGNPSTDLRSVLAGVTYVFWHGTSVKPLEPANKPKTEGPSPEPKSSHKRKR